MRDVLIKAYLDYRNNYLTMEVYAEHNGMTVEQAAKLIHLGAELNFSKHPDA